MVGNWTEDLYWVRNGRVLFKIPTRDDAEKNDTVYLYWGRSGRVWRCLSLLETVW